jgi:molybdopterin adenylyltransferase
MAHGDHGHDHDHGPNHGKPRGPHRDEGHTHAHDASERRVAGEHVHEHTHDDGTVHAHAHDHGHDHQHRPDEAPRIHRASAPRRVLVGVITASDTRTAETDTSGRYLRETLEDRGHPVVSTAVVRDEPALVIDAVRAARQAGAEVVIVTGGTGISRRDSSFEAIDGLLHKRIPGFGEIFRLLSFQEIGSAAMLSRATAGVTDEGLVIFSVPGSTGACRTALEKLILPEIGHLVREVTK